MASEYLVAISYRHHQRSGVGRQSLMASTSVTELGHALDPTTGRTLCGHPIPATEPAILWAEWQGSRCDRCVAELGQRASG